MGSPRTARDARSPPDAACLTAVETVTKMERLNSVVDDTKKNLAGSYKKMKKE